MPVAFFRFSFVNSLCTAAWLASFTTNLQLWDTVFLQEGLIHVKSRRRINLILKYLLHLQNNCSSFLQFLVSLRVSTLLLQRLPVLYTDDLVEYFCLIAAQNLLGVFSLSFNKSLWYLLLHSFTKLVTLFR